MPDLLLGGRLGGGGLLHLLLVLALQLLFFLLLFTLPTILGVVDYFFPFSKVPGGGYGSLDPAQAEWRMRLRAFYSEHNPGKMDEIPNLLRKYKGKERLLWRKLNKKYAPKDDD